MTRRRCCPRWKPRACGSSEAQFATHSPETGAIDSTSTSQSQMLSAGLGAPRRRSAHRRSRSAPTSTSGESRWATVRSTSGISRMMISTAICDAVISRSTPWPFHWIGFAWVRFRNCWSIPLGDVMTSPSAGCASSQMARYATIPCDCCARCGWNRNMAGGLMLSFARQCGATPP